MFSLVSLCLLSFGVQIAYEDKSIVIKVQTDKDIKVQDNIIDILYIYHMCLKSFCISCFKLFTLVDEAFH